jgi:RND family efflux transporter MFP subunit
VVYKKQVGFAAIAVVVVGASFLYVANKNAPEEPNKVLTALAGRDDIRQVVSATGRVVSNLDVDIKCKASGEVVKLPFDVSDSVKKGELLLELDPIDQQRVLTKAEVALKASQARLATATNNLKIAELNLQTERRKADAELMSAESKNKDEKAKAEREKELLKEKLASQEEFDTAQTAAVEASAEYENAKTAIEELKQKEIGLELKREDVQLAESDVELDQLDVAVAQDRLHDTKVESPMDGVVTARNVQTGQIIASGVSNVGGGTTVLTLSDMSRIFVLASVDESDIGKVKTGQNVIVTADAYPGKRFDAEVVRICAKGANVSNVVTFEVKLELTGENKSLLRPEMTANVDIDTASKKAALCVPVEAVVRQAGKSVVTVIKPDGGTEERTVETGICDLMNIEITKGLKEGDKVMLYQTENQSRWSEKVKARVRQRMMFGR